MSWDWEKEVEILSDPALDDQQAADKIAELTKTEIVPIPSHTWLGWLGGDSRYLRLQQLAANENADGTARNVAIVAMKLCDSPEASLRLDDPAHQEMLASVASAVQATQEEIAEITALGTRTVKKYSEQILPGHVYAVRNRLYD